VAASARVMVPVEIIIDMLKTGTSIPETDAAKGEVAWTSGAAYTAGDLRVSRGSVWVCKLTHSGRTEIPEADTKHWGRNGPSNRMAPFDDYANTKAVGTGSITYVLQPGFFNGLAVYGMEGATYSVVVKASPGGAVMRKWSGDLFSQASGFYELLFAPLVQTVQLSFDDIPLGPDAEVTLQITSSPGKRVAVGTIKVGDWRQFIGERMRGGAEYGAQSERKPHTLRQYNEDGTYKIVRRTSSRNVSCSIKVDGDQAMYADAILGEIEDIAVPFEATDLPRYGYLNTLGFVSGSIRADNFSTASINLKVEGNI
jgi:hypothetical protein